MGRPRSRWSGRILPFWSREPRERTGTTGSWVVGRPADSFGVMIVVLHGWSFEVATFRKESGYLDGRRPTRVEFADAKADVLRRDFTVNGLFFDPLKKQTHDWVGGVGDIRKKIIKTIGDPEERFSEDKLRLLRAVRFASNLGFRLEPKTLLAIRKMSGKISVVSQERIRDELIKLFTGPRPGYGFELLDRTGLLKVVLPEMTRLKKVPQPRQYHPEGDVFRHMRIMMGLLKNPPVVLRRDSGTVVVRNGLIASAGRQNGFVLPFVNPRVSGRPTNPQFRKCRRATLRGL